MKRHMSWAIGYGESERPERSNPSPMTLAAWTRVHRRRRSTGGRQQAPGPMTPSTGLVTIAHNSISQLTVMCFRNETRMSLIYNHGVKKIWCPGKTLVWRPPRHRTVRLGRTRHSVGPAKNYLCLRLRFLPDGWDKRGGVDVIFVYVLTTPVSSQRRTSPHCHSLAPLLPDLDNTRQDIRAPCRHPHWRCPSPTNLSACARMRGQIFIASKSIRRAEAGSEGGWCLVPVGTEQWVLCRT